MYWKMAASAVGIRRKQDGDPKRRCALYRRWPWGNSGLQRVNTVPHKVAGPKPNGVFPNTRALAIRPIVQPDIVSTMARARSASPRSRDQGQLRQCRLLFLGCPQRGFPAHASPSAFPRANRIKPTSVGQPGNFCLASQGAPSAMHFQQSLHRFFVGARHHAQDFGLFATIGGDIGVTHAGINVDRLPLFQHDGIVEL